MQDGALCRARFCHPTARTRRLNESFLDRHSLCTTDGIGPLGDEIRPAWPPEAMPVGGPA
jgi:hypothetical protein